MVVCVWWKTSHVLLICYVYIVGFCWFGSILVFSCLHINLLRLSFRWCVWRWGWVIWCRCVELWLESKETKEVGGNSKIWLLYTDPIRVSSLYTHFVCILVIVGGWCSVSCWLFSGSLYDQLLSEPYIKYWLRYAAPSKPSTVRHNKIMIFFCSMVTCSCCCGVGNRVGSIIETKGKKNIVIDCVEVRIGKEVVLNWLSPNI